MCFEFDKGDVMSLAQVPVGGSFLIVGWQASECITQLRERYTQNRVAVLLTLCVVLAAHVQVWFTLCFLNDTKIKLPEAAMALLFMALMMYWSFSLVKAVQSLDTIKETQPDCVKTLRGHMGPFVVVALLMLVVGAINHNFVVPKHGILSPENWLRFLGLITVVSLYKFRSQALAYYVAMPTIILLICLLFWTQAMRKHIEQPFVPSQPVPQQLARSGR